MIVTVFRTRLNPDPVALHEYQQMAARMAGLAQTMPGYISHKGFAAEDGERVTIVEFESEEGMRAWATHPEHVAAMKLGRQSFYTEYSSQVCTVQRSSGHPKAR